MRSGVTFRTHMSAEDQTASRLQKSELRLSACDVALSGINKFAQLQQSTNSLLKCHAKSLIMPRHKVAGWFVAAAALAILHSLSPALVDFVWKPHDFKANLQVFAFADIAFISLNRLPGNPTHLSTFRRAAALDWWHRPQHELGPQSPQDNAIIVLIGSWAHENFHPSRTSTKLMSELDRLRVLDAENKRLIALLDSHGVDWRLDANGSSAPNAQPSPEPTHISTNEKVALFRPLFRGLVARMSTLFAGKARAVESLDTPQLALTSGRTAAFATNGFQERPLKSPSRAPWDQIKRWRLKQCLAMRRVCSAPPRPLERP